MRWERLYPACKGTGRVVSIPTDFLWEQKLRQMAMEIRRDAQGKTCLECWHYSGTCRFVLNLEPSPHLESAPACPNWESKF